MRQHKLKTVNHSVILNLKAPYRLFCQKAFQGMKLKLQNLQQNNLLVAFNFIDTW